MYLTKLLSTCGTHNYYHFGHLLRVVYSVFGFFYLITFKRVLVSNRTPLTCGTVGRGSSPISHQPPAATHRVGRHVRQLHVGVVRAAQRRGRARGQHALLQRPARRHERRAVADALRGAHPGGR